MALFKEKLLGIERAVQEELNPLGFKKQKSIWRRSIAEVLQQFSIVSQQLIASYHAEWGLNLISFCEDPRPLPHRLQVRWFTTNSVKPRRRMLEVSEALDLESDLSDAERARVVTQLLKIDVIPCFEAFQTKESVRRMMRDWKYPRRAQMFFNLPNEWWPADVG